MKNLILKRRHWEEMLAHVTKCLPEEACGLVASSQTISQAVYPITNVLRSSVRFRMDPLEQLTAFLDYEKHGWDLAAIYHSHPKGPPEPSPTDLAEFAYPRVLYLIWFPDDAAWMCESYEILGNKWVSKAKLQIVDLV
jgi:proteasome lid subunit RPN8/RPN11